MMFLWHDLGEVRTGIDLYCSTVSILIIDEAFRQFYFIFIIYYTSIEHFKDILCIIPCQIK